MMGNTLMLESSEHQINPFASCTPNQGHSDEGPVGKVVEKLGNLTKLAKNWQ